MINSLAAPGVAGGEGPSGGGPVDGVATSVAGFVGFTSKGPVGRPLRVTSLADFAEHFGFPMAAGPTALAVRLFFENGGREAYVVRVAPEFAKPPGGKPLIAGLHALDEVEDLCLLIVPDTAALPGKSAAAVAKVALSYAEERRAFCLLDPPGVAEGPGAIAEALEWLAANPVLRHRNAALYLPALQVDGPAGGRRGVLVGASGAVAGLYARLDRCRGVWQAPAGSSANLKGVAGLAHALSDREAERLTRQGVNVLGEVSERGILASSALTLEAGAASDSELRYVNLCRYFLFLESSIHRGTQWAVSGPNGEPLWARLRLAVSSFMNLQFRQGALRGSRPEQAYFVRCDADTMSERDRKTGSVRIQVGFAPLKPAEFVVFDVVQKCDPT